MTKRARLMRINFNRTRMTKFTTNRHRCMTVFINWRRYVAARGGTVAATGRRAIRDKGAPGDYKILTTSEGPYRLACFSPARPKLAFFRRSVSPSTSESYECTIGIRRKRQKHRERVGERETERSSGGHAAPRVTDRDRYRHHMCNARRKVSARFIKVPPIPAESFLHGKD